MSLRLVPVIDPAALEARAADWTALLARSASNRPMQAPLWLLPWWRVFGATEGRRLAAALLFDGDRLVGLAPLLRRIWWHRKAIPFRRLELLGTGEREADEIVSDFLGVIAERGYEDAVAAALARSVADGAFGGCDEIVLSALESDQPAGRALARELSAHGLTVEEQSIGVSPYVALPARWEDYLAALSGSGRYLVNRSLRDFDKWAGGDAVFERVRTPDDLAEGKRILVRLHEQRWLAAGQAGVFASRLFSRFHDDVLPALLAQEALDLCWLKVRGEPVAVAYNIVWDNKVYFYQGGRTLEVPKGIRPGIVLHARAIRAAIEARRAEYDFLLGQSQYKLQLATGSRGLIQIRANRSPVRNLACALLDRGAAYVRRLRAQHAQNGQGAKGGQDDQRGKNAKDAKDTKNADGAKNANGESAEQHAQGAPATP